MDRLSRSIQSVVKGVGDDTSGMASIGISVQKIHDRVLRCGDGKAVDDSDVRDRHLGPMQADMGHPGGAPARHGDLHLTDGKIT